MSSISLQDLFTPLGYLLLLIGLGMVFMGKKIFKALLFVVGGLIVGGSASLLLLHFGVNIWLVLFCAVAGFFAGGYLSLNFFYLVIFSIGFLAGIVLGPLIFPQEGIAQLLTIIIIGSISGVIVVVIFEAFLAISTAFSGSKLMGFGLTLIGVQPSQAEVLSWTFFFIGAVFQVFLLDPIWAKSIDKTMQSLDEYLGEKFSRIHLFEKPRRILLYKKVGGRELPERFYYRNSRDLVKPFKKSIEAYKKKKLSFSSFRGNVNIILYNLWEEAYLSEEQSNQQSQIRAHDLFTELLKEAQSFGYDKEALVSYIRWRNEYLTGAALTELERLIKETLQS